MANRVPFFLMWVEAKGELWHYHCANSIQTDLKSSTLSHNWIIDWLLCMYCSFIMFIWRILVDMATKRTNKNCYMLMLWVHAIEKKFHSNFELNDWFERFEFLIMNLTAYTIEKLKQFILYNKHNLLWMHLFIHKTVFQLYHTS